MIQRRTQPQLFEVEGCDKAIALQPEMGEAWVAQGAHCRVLRETYAGRARICRVAKRIPNSALVYEYMAYVERRLGRWKEAEEHYHRAAELDPLDLQLFASMGGEFLNLLRRFPEAQAALDRALQAAPHDEGVPANVARHSFSPTVDFRGCPTVGTHSG